MIFLSTEIFSVKRSRKENLSKTLLNTQEVFENSHEIRRMKEEFVEVDEELMRGKAETDVGRSGKKKFQILLPIF